MDEITKKIVRRAMKENPGLPVRFVISCIRIKQRLVHLETITKTRRKA